MALSHWMQRPCLAVAEGVFATQVLQRARRTSLVAFLRRISSGVNWRRVLGYVFSSVTSGTRQTHCGEAVATKAGRCGRTVFPSAMCTCISSVGVGGCFPDSGLRYWVHRRSIPCSKTLYHASRSQTVTNSRRGRSLSGILLRGLQFRQ